MSLHVAVAIVGYRNAADIVRCLAALAASQHADFEVVICENGGPDAFAALTAAIPTVLPGGQPVRALQAPGNLGFAGGVNVCLREARDADAWWVLNPDTEPGPGSLAAKVERLARGDVAAVGCTLYRPNGRVQSHGGRWRPWLARAESIGHGDPWPAQPNAAQVEAAQNYLNGAAMLIGRRFVEAVGPMREDYFLYCEEVAWCLDGAAAGLKLGYAENAAVLHHQGTTTGAGEDPIRRPRMPIYLGERNKLLVTRDCFPARLPAAALAALSLALLRYGRAGAWRQLSYALSGWAAGLRGARGAGPWASGEGAA